jgi:cell wall-associated NlpC family hydrolase
MLGSIPDDRLGASVMVAGIDLGKAIDHANNFWAGLCQDGTVALQSGPIRIADEYRHFQLDPKGWEPVFLNYDTSNQDTEGLYFIPAGQADLDFRIQHDFRADAFPDRWFICSWRDAGIDVDRGSNNPDGKPHHFGLDDCAHFVGECLRKAGVSVPVNAIDVDTLLAFLRGFPGTQTLAWFVPFENAQRIIRANPARSLFSGVPSVLRVGDVIAFGNDKKTHHIHSTIYLGNEQITHHTVVNHPSKSNHQRLDPATNIKQNWEFEAHPKHPRVSIIHFARPGEKPAPWSPMIGWWAATSGTQTFFYSFRPDGHVSWTSIRPAKSEPGAALPNQTGIWFESTVDLRICWTFTGSFEIYQTGLRPGTTFAGKWNDQDITIVKLSF